MPDVLRGVAAGALLAVVGALTAVPAVVLHQRWWGLALGLLTPLAVLVALPGGWLRVGYAGGWATGVALAVSAPPGGDNLVPSTVPGHVLLVATAAFVVVAMVTIPARGAREDQGSATARP